MSKIIRITGVQVQMLRKSMGLTQSNFWNKIGSTQSAGSRYETGREIPIATEVLLRVVYLMQSLDDALNSVAVFPRVEAVSKLKEYDSAKTKAALRKELKIRT